MRSRLWLIVILLAASVACNLGAVPTLQPTTAAGPNNNSAATTDASGSVAAGPTAACTPRSDWPTMVIADGDTLSGISQRTGASIDDLVAANCLSNAASIVAGQTLRVPVVPADAAGSAGSGSSGSTGGGNGSGVYAPTSVGGGPNNGQSNCASSDNWFFIFSFGASESSCPGPAIVSNVVAQNFQNGRVYRYDAAQSETQATIYVIYNDFTWESYPDTADPSQASSAIGRLLQQPGLSSRLGAAYPAEPPYTGRRQYPSGNAGYFYIDHGLRKLVLRLNSPPRSWEVVGYYQ